ncbi:hypothetical protein E1A91_D02G211400v1, partial [Gossypium mustelinum]
EKEFLYSYTNPYVFSPLFFYLYLPLKRLNIIDDFIMHTSFVCDFVTSWYKSYRYFILSLIFSFLTYKNQHN